METEIERAGGPLALDLEQLDRVDIEAVRLLNVCVAEGVSVLNGSRYVREWMLWERGTRKRNRKRKKGHAPFEGEDGKNI